MNWLPRLSVNRPVTAIMAFVAFCVLGMIAWTKIPLELLPSGFSNNSLWMRVPYTDAQPRETEEKITLPVEDRLADIQGLKSIRSRSQSGSASFQLEFHRSTPPTTAYNAVVDRMERAVLDLPDDAREYFIYKWDASDAPIMWTGLGMDGTPEEQYRQLYKQVKPRLERSSGVGDVRAWGPDPKQIFISFARDKLHKHRLSQYEILQSLRAENFQLPSGKITENGQVRYVRSLSRLDGIDSLSRFPAGENIELSDVANVQYRLARSADIARIQGKDGAGIGIRKESDANTVETAKQLREKMEVIAEESGVEFYPFFDQGKIIESALDNLVNAALTGGLFAVIVLYFFLRNMSMTLLIAACIPFTLIASVGAVYSSGGTLNVLSLMGLMIAVGMVVDNAIVVVESIYTRRLSGADPKSGAIDGASEISLAITLSTLTSVAVFLPVILMNQDADYAFFLGVIGFPIVVALGASLLAALGFTPLTTTFLTAKQLTEPRIILWLKSRYTRALSWTLRHRSDSLLFLFFLMCLTALPVSKVGCSDRSEAENRFEIRYTIPPQFTYAQRVDLVDQVEAFVEENRERWGLEFLVSRLEGGSYNGETELYLYDDNRGDIPPKKVFKEAKKGLPQIPGVKMKVDWDGNSQKSQKFTVVLRGENTAELEEFSEQVSSRLLGVEGVIGVEKELEEGSLPEIQLVIDRDAATKFGVSAQNIAWTVASALRSNELPEQRVDGEDVDVVARFQYADRSDVDRLLTYPIYSNVLKDITPLSSLVTVETKPSLGVIRRRGRKTAFPLTVSLEQESDDKKVRQAVNSALLQLEYPSGVGFDPPFDPSTLEDNSAMTLSLIMSIALVFLIMGALFESFMLPLVIITTVPMAAVGAFWALYFTGSGMSPIAGIGMVILIGVVVNNGIVLIEVVNRFRKQGLNRFDALVKAGEHRIRPILMTALTTICGLMPMAMGNSEAGGISYGPMGKVVVGGMIMGTFLTLFFIPLMYLIFADMRDRAKVWLSWLAGNPVTEGGTQ